MRRIIESRLILVEFPPARTFTQAIRSEWSPALMVSATRQRRSLQPNLERVPNSDIHLHWVAQRSGRISGCPGSLIVRAGIASISSRWKSAVRDLAPHFGRKTAE